MRQGTNRMKKWKMRPVYIGFFITLFTAAMIMNLVYMVYYSYSARKLSESERSRVLSQMVFYTDRYLKEVENCSDILAISSSVQKLMTHRIKKDYMDYLKCSETLTGYTMTTPGIYRIDLYIEDGHTLLTSYEGVYYDLPYEDYKSYQDYLNMEDSRYWSLDYSGTEPSLVSTTRNEHYITLIKPVFSKHSGKKTGVLLVSILLSEIQDMIPVDTSEEEGMLITYEGKPLWDNEITITNITRQDVQTSDYSGMKFYYYYATEWLAGNLKMMLSILVITAFFGIIFFSIVEISERKMFAPVKQLLNGFKEVEKGNFDVCLDESRSDLFQEIFQRFNHMVRTLEQMIQELSTERTRRNEFKFRLLQMQIKPHFLYNLFNNMIWMIEQKDYEKLEVLIQSTAGYYKTALNFGNQDIMLVENKKQLEYYAEIQRIRFGDSFTFSVLIPDEIQFYSIPNLLLQPLVENSIVHGLKGVEGRHCHINVTAGSDDADLILTVEDDGCGIDADVLEDIHMELRNYEGDGSKYFALINIMARIQNRYKGRASMKLESEFNIGTKVIIRIPLNEVK